HGARAVHRRRTRGCAGRHLLAVDAGLRDAHRTPAVRRLPRGAPDGGALHGDRAAGARGAPRGPAGHLAGAGEGDGQGTGGPLSRRRGVPRRPGITLVTDAPFVGRRAELAELAAALDQAKRGRGSVHLVAGEGGVGKTRLTSVVSGLARE